MSCRSASPRNRLLAALPNTERDAVLARAEPVLLKRRQVLQEPNLPMLQAYFIETGAASVLARAGQGEMIEVAIVGRPGLVGVPLVLGTGRSPHRSIMQIAGEAWRVGAADLADLMERSEALRRILLAYVQASLVQSSQLVVCNARHSLEQRLARWLLMTADRLLDDRIPLTHELLSKMLGVRRPGITEAAGHLERAGMIRKGRGSLVILDRARLEEAACGCYRIITAEYDRLVPAEPRADDAGCATHATGRRN